MRSRSVHQAKRAGQEAQVVRHRLAQREDAQDERVDVHLVAVDVPVELLDLGRELRSTPSQNAFSASCSAALAAGAHGERVRPQLAQLGLEVAARVRAVRHASQPNLPVM